MPNRTQTDATAQALRDTLISPNECDSNWEAANVTDGLFRLDRSVEHAADRIASALLAVAEAVRDCP